MESTVAPRRRFQFTLRELLLTVSFTFLGISALNPLLFPEHPGPGSAVIIVMTAIGACLSFSERTPTERTRSVLLLGYVASAWVLLVLLCFFRKRESLFILAVILFPILVGFFAASVRSRSKPVDQRRALMPIVWAFGISGIMFVLSTFVIPHSIRQRMATCDSSAAAGCKAFAEAEEIYHRTDYAGTGVLQYAQHLKGNNSLLERTAGAGDLALVDKTFGNAEIGPNMSEKAGYVFKILLAQGSNATGGARSYIDANGHMTLGYALVACPYRYNVTGRDTYIINGNGTIFQKDLGPDTPFIAANMTEFDPDPSWVPTQ